MNIPEILVANGTGAVLVSFLLLLRVRGESKNSVGTELFCRILVVTLLAQATETISFLLDGVPGAASRFWLYLTNTVCTGATVCVGYAWCLYVDFRVYRSIGRLRRRHLLLGAPLLALLVLLVANSVAIRMSGDEFMVLIRHGSEELLDEICTAIEQRVQHYNETAPAGSFQLSFSTGVAKYEGGSVEKFLVELDQRMYAEKRAFHAARDGHAVPEQGNAPSI